MILKKRNRISTRGMSGWQNLQNCFRELELAGQVDAGEVSEERRVYGFRRTTLDEAGSARLSEGAVPFRPPAFRPLVGGCMDFVAMMCGHSESSH